MDNLRPCPKCGTTPVQQTETKMFGSAIDANCRVTFGRYACPECGAGPPWFMAYCVDSGWARSAETWNSFASRGKNAENSLDKNQ